MVLQIFRGLLNVTEYVIKFVTEFVIKCVLELIGKIVGFLKLRS
jgi:hypothetical protein